MAAGLSLIFAVFSFFVTALVFFTGWTYLYYYFFHFRIPIGQVNLTFQTVLVHSFPVFRDLIKDVAFKLQEFVFNEPSLFLSIVGVMILYIIFGWRNTVISKISISLIAIHLVISAFYLFVMAHEHAKRMGNNIAITTRLSQSEKIEVIFKENFIPPIANAFGRRLSNDQYLQEIVKDFEREADDRVLLLIFATESYYYVISQLLHQRSSDDNDISSIESKEQHDTEPGRVYIIQAKDVILFRRGIKETTSDLLESSSEPAKD